MATISQNGSQSEAVDDEPRSNIVHTKSGPVQGFLSRLRTGQWSEIFLDIPFAKPPVGELRFEKPEPADPWTEVFQALQFGPASIPLDLAAFRAQPCSEDCLRLNIFRPFPPPSTPLPVFLYIHGGGFCSGSAREYGFLGWAENFLPEGLLVVTIQYRLGPFGFLTLGNSDLPGDLGLWDMAMALRFVHENIAHFGGDPQRVTVAGLSAGGAAAAIMALSPWTREWVWASVEMSGTVLAEWTASERTVEAGREFVRRALGAEVVEKANFDGKNNIKQMLKGLSVERILEIVNQMGTTRPEPNLLVWAPRIDGLFLPKDFPSLLLELPVPKPALMGLTEKEAIYFAIQDKDKFLNPFGIPKAELSSFGRKEFGEFVQRVVLGSTFRRHLERSGKLSDDELDASIGELAADICRFYIGKEVEEDGLEGQKGLKDGHHGPMAKQFILEQYTRLISDLLFNVSLFRMAQIRRERGHPTFLYLNCFFNTNQFEPWIPVKGATHGNEYPYMNGLFPVGEFTFTEQDNSHRRTLAKMLASFVKNRIPAVEGLGQEWPSNADNSRAREETLEGLKFVLIRKEDGKCSVGGIGDNAVDRMRQSSHFWMEFNQKCGFDTIRGVPINKGLARMNNVIGK